MLAPVTLDLGDSHMSSFVLQDASGLAPLTLPEALLNSNRLPDSENKNLPQPSSDAVRRFQAAMESQPRASVLHAVSRSAAESSSAATPNIDTCKLQGHEAPNLQSPTLPHVIPVSPEEAETLAPTKLFTSSEGTPLPYRIFMPDTTNARGTEPDTLPTFPLVLFMHGAGTRGDNGAALDGNICFRDLLGWAEKVEPAIVIAPQCPVDRQWVDTPWSDAKHVYSPIPSKYMAAALELLDTALAMLPVDHSRILVCGNSMGGYATWDILARRPGLFAAALPVCGGGDPEKIVEVSHDVPIWAFHGDADTTVPVANSRNIVEMLEADPERTAEIRYRELPDVGHDSWTDTFSDREVLSWFFAQKRIDTPVNISTTQPPDLPTSRPQDLQTSRPPDLQTPRPPDLQTSQPPTSLREKDETDDIGRPDILPAAISNPLTQAVIPQATVATDEAAAVSARTEAIAETVSHVVEAVAATIVVEPSLKQGEGSVTIHLKPEVLDGSELRLVAQDGLLTLELTPATPTAEQMIARSVPQLEHALAGHIDAFHGFNVVMKRGKFDEAK